MASDAVIGTKKAIIADMMIFMVILLLGTASESER
jgi:hypothetical protein